MGFYYFPPREKGGEGGEASGNIKPVKKPVEIGGGGGQKPMEKTFFSKVKKTKYLHETPSNFVHFQNIQR